MKRFKMPALLALAATAAFAADVTGDWTAQMGGPDGNGPTVTFHFKQDGAKLTGTVDGPGGDAMQISDGKVDGDAISFTLTMGEGDGGKMIHSGTIKGDEISLTVKMEGGGRGGPGGPGGRGPGGRGGDEGGRGPGGPGGPGGGPPAMTLKRVK